MPAEHRHIKEYEREILELRAQGNAKKEIFLAGETQTIHPCGSCCWRNSCAA